MENKFKNCPRCSSSNVKLNGHTCKRVQRLVCKACGKHFQAHYSHVLKRNPNLKDLIRKSLFEKISLRGITRLTHVSMTWLLKFSRRIWQDFEKALTIDWTKYRCQYIEIQIDEFWTYCQQKDRRQWLNVARHVESAKIIAHAFGGRDSTYVEQVLHQIPENIRLNAYYFTDDWGAFARVIPPERHRIGKAYTHEIEGLFSAFRQRCNRLVRKTTGFSKDLTNHKLAIRALMGFYNRAAEN